MKVLSAPTVHCMAKKIKGSLKTFYKFFFYLNYQKKNSINYEGLLGRRRLRMRKRICKQLAYLAIFTYPCIFLSFSLLFCLSSIGTPRFGIFRKEDCIHLNRVSACIAVTDDRAIVYRNAFS